MSFSFGIDKRLLGTKKHFINRQGSYFWSKDVPDYAWHLSGDEKQDSNLCLDTLLKLNSLSVNINPPEKFLNVFSKFNLSGSAIPWQQALPRDVYRTFSKDIIRQSNVAMKQSSKDYYKSIWIPGNFVLNSLVRAKANVDEYNQIINDDNTLSKAVVESFKPQAAGYLAPIVYNRFGTRTGRLTVQSGPMILTVKKEYRYRLIKSRYPNGKIVEIDCSNLEPRVILHESGKVCEELDLYSKINDERFGGQGNRNMIKGAVIAELYGMSKKTLQKNLNVPMSVINEFTKIMGEYFQTKDILKRVKNEFIQKGFITNKFGRQVLIDAPLDRIFTNSWAQSSAVDIAMLGFEQMIKRFEDRKIKPIFLVVDALLLDVDEKELGFVQSLKHVNVCGNNYPVKITVYC